MKTTGPIRAVWLAGLAIAGCGGGGSSGGGAVTPPRPEQPPTPLPAVVLDSTVAVDAGAIVIRALEQAGAAAEVAAFVSDQQSGQEATAARCVTPNADSVYIDNGDGRFSRGDRLTVLYAGCLGATGEAGITLEEVDLAANRIVAQVGFSSTDANGNTVEGSFELASTYALTTVGRTQTLSEIELVYVRGGTAETIMDARVERSYDAEQQYSYALTGDVVSGALDGDFGFSTESPLTGRFGAPPTAGALLITSENRRARFSPATDVERRATMASLQIDTGSGSFGAPLQVPWSPLTTGLLFDWRPVLAPFISALSILPERATSLDELSVSYEVDYAGEDALRPSYFWYRNGTQLSRSFTATLPVGQYRRGDVIELRLRVQNQAAVFDERSVSITIGNAPPASVGVVLSPERPSDDDDIEMVWNATDPDGDALTATYEWYLNGARVADQTEAVLPRSVHRGNDEIRGVVTISDGEFTVSAEATATIGDTPATVSLPSVPAVAVRGVPIQFDAQLDDPDGDPLGARRFRLAYGPSDMTINPTTGRISFTDRAPMLGSRRNVHFGITLDQPGGANIATGTIEVTHPNYALPRMWATMLPPQRGGLQVGNFDAEGDDEILVLSDSTVYELTRVSGSDFRQSWTHLLGFGGSASVTGMTAGDIDGDARFEIFLASGRTVIRLDGMTRRETGRAVLGVDASFVCRDMAVADLDRNGGAELVCLAYGTGGNPMGSVVVLDAATLSEIKRYPNAQYGESLAVGNVDTDPALEIVTAGGYVFDGAAVIAAGFAAEWRYTAGFGWIVEVGDTNEDGVAEIVATSRSGPTRAFDAVTRSVRWTAPSLNASAVAIADIRGDDRNEIIVGDFLFGLIAQISVYEEEDDGDSVRLRYREPAESTSGVLAIAVGELRGNDNPEVVWGAGNTDLIIAEARSGELDIRWRLTDGVPPTYGPYVGGQLAGGAGNPPSPVFAGRVSRTAGSETRLLSMHAGNGAITFSDPIDPVDALALTVADYDNDGRIETLLAARDDRDGYYLAYDLWADDEKWRSGNVRDESPAAALAAADVNGDGNADLVALTTTGDLRVYDVDADALIWRSDGVGVAGHDVEIGDLDGDGVPEIVAAVDDRVIVFGRAGNGSYSQRASAVFAGPRDLEIVDIDGNGTAGIYLIHGGSTGTEYKRLDAGLVVQAAVGFDWRANALLTERPGGARTNLALVEDAAQPVIVVIDPRTGTEIWRSTRVSGRVAKDSAYFVDTGGDGVWELGIATTKGILLSR